jgi:hypothetical protein
MGRAMMIVLRDPTTVSLIEDPALRALLTQRFEEISQDQPYDPNLLGYFVVVEPDDSVPALEAQTGCSIVRGRFGGAQYGQPGFAPAFEFIEEHPHCYEMVFVLSDDGFGIDIFVPKLPGIDSQLLALCVSYAITAGVIPSAAQP